jgi:hypothetical protein
MKWRDITEDEIQSVLERAEEVRDSVRGRKNARARVGLRLLQVTYKEEQDRTVVITVIDKTR